MDFVFEADRGGQLLKPLGGVRTIAHRTAAASAVSGETPPAGPQWVTRLAPLPPLPLAYDKHLCASLDGFTLHAATRAGAMDPTGREALLCYVLRPPIAHERLEQRPDGLVRITLKKPYTDGTVAVDMDPLSLLSRLATRFPHGASTPFATRAYSGPGAHGDHASHRSPRKRPRPKASPNRRSPPSGPFERGTAEDTARGRSCWPAPSPWMSSLVPGATGA